MLNLILVPFLSYLAFMPQQAADLPIIDQFDGEPAQRWETFGCEWEFAGGVAIQDAADYDCGAGRDIYLDKPFYLSVRFKPESGFNGGGLFFAMESPDGKASSMMVRCDPGGRILWGWFDEAGTFNYAGDATIDDLGPVEQELAVAVDPEKLAFNIFLDGVKVRTNVKTFHAAGYVGLQSSGGPHRFTRFEVREATAEELDGIKLPGKYSRIVNVIGNKRRLVALRHAPKFLVAFDEDGEEVDRAVLTDVHGLEDDTLGVVDLCWENLNAWEGQPGIYVLAENGQAVYRFNYLLDQVGTGPIIRNEAMRGKSIAVDSAGRIFIADDAIPGLRVYSSDGAELLAYGEEGSGGVYDRNSEKWAGKFQQPRGIAVSPDDLIVVTNRTAFTYVGYRYDAEENELQWELNGPWLPNPEGVGFDRDGNLLLAHTYEYYRSYGAFRVLDLDGRSLNVYRGHALGDMSEKVRACEGPGGKYYVADPDKERIVVLPSGFVERVPELTWDDNGALRLRLTRTDGTTMEVTSLQSSSERKGWLMIQPTESPAEVWPEPEPTDLLAYHLPPKPPAGQMYVIDMPVLVAVFAKVRDNDGKLIEVDTDGVVERLQRELEVDRTFYWLNSHALLNKEFEYMVIDALEPSLSGGWISPTDGRRLVNQARAQRGLARLDADHSLICIHPMAGFQPGRQDEPGWVSGGGLTTYAYSGYALWNNGQGWLMGHEWGHQLDSYFDASGMTGWWLNHPDGTVHVGRYGEHWDCNAFLCRRIDRINWLRFRFGTARLTDDRDEDGLPDRDPRLPVDEARFGSSSRLVDTDADGLSDLAELTAGTFTSSDPTEVDTDRDGILDGRDPYPQFAVRTELEHAEPGMDGWPVPRAFGPIGIVNRDWVEAIVNGAYDADHVYLLIGLPKGDPRHLHVTVDFLNDGWFVGRDNVYAWLELDWSGPSPGIQRSHACEARVLPPASGVPVDLMPACSAVMLRVQRPDTRSPLKAGSAVGITFRVQHAPGQVAFLIDPWQILGLALQ